MRARSKTIVRVRRCGAPAWPWSAGAGAILLAVCCPLGAADAPAAAPSVRRPPQRTVPEWIEALGQPDDTLFDDERPQSWIAKHLDDFYPALLAALDHPSERIAREAFALLDRGPAKPELATALIRLAQQPKHLLNAEATYALCRFSDDPRVRPILAAALADPGAFPDSSERARFAVALGQHKRAVAMLVPFLRAGLEKDVIATIAELESIKHPSAVAPLLRLARDRRWEVARAAYLALAILDPRNHGLKKSQQALLEICTRRPGPHPLSPAEKREQLLALPRAEVRSLFLGMLATDARSDALDILARWQDRAALPQVKALLGRRNDPRIDDVVRAYLSIDDTKAAADDVVRVATAAPSDFGCVAIVRGVAAASSARRAYVLRQIHDRVGGKWPDVIPRGLRHAQADIAPLLGPLLATEENPRALGLYAELVARQPSQGHEAPVRRALAVLRSQGAAESLGDAATSARAVLDASIALGLSGIETDLAPMLTAQDRQVRRQAACAAALQHDGEAAWSRLYDELGGERREWAAACLLRLPCRTEAERSRREAAVLALLGKPAEDFALRVLVTCAGPRTTAALLPVLDGPSVQRAVHAAWVLAQSPQADIANRAWRRLALHGLLHRQTEQHGEAMSFAVAPGIFFHQLFDSARERDDDAKVVLPSPLQPPARLDQQELDFLMRAYRDRLADDARFDLFGTAVMYDMLAARTDASWTPFFQMVAREDPRLTAWRVSGQSVAHHLQRRLAAEVVARLTGRPASYVGLQGEALDSTTVPAKPYADQNRLIARRLLDRMVAEGATQAAQREPGWARRPYYDELVSDLVGAASFGPELKTEILQEASRRGLADALRAAGLRLWTEP